MTGRTRIKICGLTRLEDAELAVSLGADAVGFVFWRPSPRVVDRDRARAIARALPPLTARVGVFVNMPADDLARIVEEVGLDAVQLHGDEAVESYEPLRRPLIKSVALSNDAAVIAARALPATVTPLVDAADAQRRGGTGRTADWGRAAELGRQRPIILAGGLTPENVVEAIRHVRPWAVDVSSGVEASPGVKDADRLRRFFAGVRAAESEAE